MQGLCDACGGNSATIAGQAKEGQAFATGLQPDRVKELLQDSVGHGGNHVQEAANHDVYDQSGSASDWCVGSLNRVGCEPID